MIGILLSTYNSELFLAEQLDSIIKQTYEDWILYIRDDGSVDKTRDIIYSYSNSFKDRIIFIDDNLELGVSFSFEYLLKYCKEKYIMFCDHDDVWLPTKIEETFQRMIEMEFIYPNSPILIHTDLYVVDQNLNILYDSFCKASKINPENSKKYEYLAFSNCVTGCTVLINEIVKNYVLPFPSYISMHDRWVSMIVSKYGHVSFVNKSLILYRQHSSNVVGMQKMDFFTRIKNIFKLKRQLHFYYIQYKMIKSIDQSFNLIRFFYYKFLLIYR